MYPQKRTSKGIDQTITENPEPRSRLPGPPRIFSEMQERDVYFLAEMAIQTNTTVYRKCTWTIHGHNASESSTQIL